MRNKIWIVVLLALCVCISSVAFAETVVLKSGKTIEGNLLEKTDKYIKIDFEGVVLTYFLDEIAHIDKENKDDSSLSKNTPDTEGTQEEESSIPTVVLKEGPAGIQQINEAYYNLLRLGFQKFECELTINAFESLKDMLKSKYPVTDPKSQILDSVKFHMTYGKDGKVGFNFTPFAQTGDAEIDDTIKENINDIKIALERFFESWKMYVGSPYLFFPKNVYTIEKLSDGYALSYKNIASGISAKVLIDNKLRIFEESFQREGFARKTKVHFINSKQGLLPQSFDHDFGNGTRISATVSYQEVDGFQMPKQVSVKSNSLKKGGILEIKFSDYKIEKIS